MTTSLWTRTVALGIVATASFIGNVSMSATEYPASPLPFSPARPETIPTATKPADVSTQSPTRPVAAIAADGVDDGEVVPAIFARDPDVRFMFYRHLSKWM